MYCRPRQNTFKAWTMYIYLGLNTVVNKRFSLFGMVKIRKIRHGLVGLVRKIFHGNFVFTKGAFSNYLFTLPSSFDICTNILEMANKISCQCLRTTVMILR